MPTAPDVPTWLARLWMVGGIVAGLAALIGSVIAWVLLGAAADASVRSIRLATDVLDAAGGTVVSVDAALDEVSDGLRTTQLSVADAAVTLTQLSALTSNLGDLVGEDVPDSLESVRAALAPIEATAGVLDGTLNALSFFGVDYDPAVPLDEAIDDLDQQLADIPDDLRRQGPLIQGAAESLSEFGGDTLAIADDLAGLRSRLSDTGTAVADYRATVADADALLVDVEASLTGRLTLLRWVVVLIALGLATTQTLPIALGWWFLSQTSSGKVDDEA